MTVELEEKLSAMVKEIHQKLIQGSLPFAEAGESDELTTEQFAKKLGMTARTVRGHIKRKLIENAYVAHDGHYRIPLGSVAKYRKGKKPVIEEDDAKWASQVLQMHGVGRK